MLRSRVMPTWNAIAAFSEEHVAKLVYRVLLLYLVVIVLHAIGSCKSERRELQGSADLQPLILGLNFWHTSFLTTIIVDHYPPGFCMKKMFIMIIIINVCSLVALIMLCSFGTSTEASAPTVLSFNQLNLQLC